MNTDNIHKSNNSLADPLKDQPQPFWLNTAVRTNRRGHFWIPGERVKVHGHTLQRGPMFVEWQAPEQVTQPYPIVLVHGGLLQGTEWLDTPDGRPGWAQRLAEAGYAVLVVDRPGHGRSHTHPDVIGPVGHAFSYEEGERVFFPHTDADKQTQWPFDLEDSDALDSFIAAFGPLPADFCESQEMDAERLSRLLDKIGPAILMTHSASGPLGWLVADKCPEQVVAIVSVEPMGPAFVTAPGIGTLNWGLTAAPVNYNPPRASAEEVQGADPLSLLIPAMKGIPIAIVTGEASVFATHGPAIVQFLNTAGAAAEQLHLPDYGVLGNGHGLIYEKNSDEAIKPVLNWLSKIAKPFLPDKNINQTVNNAAEKTNKITLYISYEGNSTTLFDRDYYLTVHCPLVREAWDVYGLESAGVYFPAEEEGGIILIWAGVFKDRAALDAAFKAPLTPKLMDDIKNFTNVTPGRSIATSF